MGTESISRPRALLYAVAAICYAVLARSMARHGASGMAQEHWQALVEQAMLLFLFIFGYASMGIVLHRQPQPIRQQGWKPRTGWLAETGLGVATGWALAVVCVLPLALGAGIATSLHFSAGALGWLIVDLVYFALLAAVEQTSWFGYLLQRVEELLGSTGASFVVAALYAAGHSLLPGASRASILSSFALGLLMSLAWFRTRALWLGWGIGFAWRASRALVFGLAIEGNSNLSPVVVGDPMGSYWFSGGAFGLDGTWVAFILMLAALPVVYRLTRDLDFKYNVPVFVGSGYAVDLDAAQRRQHEAAMGPAEPAQPALVQILPVMPTAENSPAPITGRPTPPEAHS